VWGEQAQPDACRGRPGLVFAPRSHHLLELLDASVRFGDRTALLCGGQHLSFLEQRTRVDAVAGALVAAGATQGQRVLLFGSNRTEWVLAFWGAVAAGALPVFGNGWWSAEQLEAAVALVEPAIVVVDEGRWPALLFPTPTITFDEIAAADGPPPPPPDAVEDSPALLLFTSGTTGLPRAAVLSHRAVIANQHNLLERTRRLPQHVADDGPATVSLLSVPLFHLGGLQAILSSVLLGSTLVFLEGRFDPLQALEVIEAVGVTTWAAVPTMIQRVVDHPCLGDRELSSVRTVMVGGAPVHPDLLRRIGVAFPNASRGAGSSYGLTEAGGVVATAVGAELVARPGAVGKPLATVEVRIAGDGQILVRSPTVMMGYWGSKDADGIDQDGWLTTGDIGRLDDDGYLYVTDRAKDIIIRGGENIASANVERILATHPAVAEVAVVGVSHPDLGEEVVAVVVGRHQQPVSLADLAAHAQSRLARFEVPSRWWLHDGPLPVTAVGKVDKRALRTALVNGAGRANARGPAS
jgi:long-chain acyl-CoA synthetase